MIIARCGFLTKPDMTVRGVFIEMTEEEASQLLMALQLNARRQEAEAGRRCPSCKQVVDDLCAAMKAEGIEERCESLRGIMPMARRIARQ